MKNLNPRIPCPHLHGCNRNNPFTRAMEPPPELSTSPATRHQAKGTTRAFSVAVGVHKSAPGEFIPDGFNVTP